MENITLCKNEDSSRYEALIGEEIAGFIDYSFLPDDVVQLPHTVVSRQHEGKGIASALTRYAFEDIVDQGKRVDPLCPFIARWVSKHPEFQHLVAVNRERGAKS